jgi:hypothetical protein
MVFKAKEKPACERVTRFLICFASGNEIKHRNEKVRRTHIQEALPDIIEDTTAQE